MSPNEDDDGKSVTTQSEYDDSQSESGIDVRGWFRSTDKVSLRWASVDAGKLQPDDELPALHCAEATSSVRVKYCEEMPWKSQQLYNDQEGDSDVSIRIQLDVSMRIQLQQPYCPGLGHLTYFPLVLDSFGQQADCLNISLDPCDGLRYWHLLTMKEGDRGPTPVADVSKRKSHLRSAEGAQSPTTSAFTSPSLDGSNVSLDTESESEDLLSTRPPRGLNIDTSMDESTLFKPLSPVHQHSLQSNGHASAIDPPASTALTPPSARQQIILFVDPSVSSLPGRVEGLSVMLHCRLSTLVRADKVDQDGTSTAWPQVVMPVWRLPTAESHQTSIQVEPAPPPAATARMIPYAKTPMQNLDGEHPQRIEIPTLLVRPHLSPVLSQPSSREPLDTFWFRLLVAAETPDESSVQEEDATGDVTVQDSLQPGGFIMSKSLSAPVPRGDVMIPGTPQSAVHRPLPVYDAITLQENDDESSKPSVIPNVKFVAWFMHHRTMSKEPREVVSDSQSTRAPRLMGELTVQWPFISTDQYAKPSQGTNAVPRSTDQQTLQQPEELDIWLPRALDEPDPVIRSCFVDESPVRFTTSDAGNSICLHIRRPAVDRGPGGNIDGNDMSDTDLPYRGRASHTHKRHAQSLHWHCGELKMLYEYPHLQWPKMDASKERKSLAPSRSSSWQSLWTAKVNSDINAMPPLHVPVPMFSQETLSMAIKLHIQGSQPPFPGIEVSGFDVSFKRLEEYASGKHSKGCTVRMRAFSVPSLTPVSVLIDSPQRSRDLHQRAFGRGLPSILGLLCIFVLLVALLLGGSKEHRVKPDLQSSLSALENRVQQLAMAADVDFSDGTWQPHRHDVASKIITMDPVPGVPIVAANEPVAPIEGRRDAQEAIAGDTHDNKNWKSRSSTRTTHREQSGETVLPRPGHVSKTTEIAIAPSPLPTILTSILNWPLGAVRRLIERIRHISLGGA